MRGLKKDVPQTVVTPQHPQHGYADHDGGQASGQVGPDIVIITICSHNDEYFFSLRLFLSMAQVERKDCSVVCLAEAIER